MSLDEFAAHIAAVNCPRFAHLTKVRDGYLLRVSNNNRGIGGGEFLFPGKREARKFAAACKAQPWNF